MIYVSCQLIFISLYVCVSLVFYLQSLLFLVVSRWITFLKDTGDLWFLWLTNSKFHITNFSYILFHCSPIWSIGLLSVRIPFDSNSTSSNLENSTSTTFTRSNNSGIRTVIPTSAPYDKYGSLLARGEGHLRRVLSTNYRSAISSKPTPKLINIWSHLQARLSRLKTMRTNLSMVIVSLLIYWWFAYRCEKIRR